MKAAMLIVLGAASALSASQTFFQNFTRTTDYTPGATFTRCVDVAMTQNGNCAVIGSDSGGAFVAFHNRSGSLLSKQNLQNATFSAVTPVRVLLDPSNGQTVVAATGWVNGSAYEVLIYRYNPDFSFASAGAYHYQAGNYDDTAFDADIDSLGRVTVVGSRGVSANDRDPTIWRVSAAGAFIYANSIPGTVANERAWGVSVGDNGTAFMCGTIATASGLTAFVSGYGVTGVQNFYREEQGGSSVSGADDVAYDSINGRVFVGGWDDLGAVINEYQLPVAAPLNTFHRAFASRYRQLEIKGGFLTAWGSYTNLSIARFEASAFPTPLWQKEYTYGASGRTVFVRGVHDDGEVYAVCWHDVLFAGSDANSKYVLAKFNGSTGALRFAASWAQDPGLRNVPSGLALHVPSGDMFISGENSSTQLTDKVRHTGYRQAPIAVSDIYYAKKNVTYNSSSTVTFNDRYYSGAICSMNTQAGHGTVTLHANRTFTYVPNSNFVGTDTFKYQLARSGVNTVVATVTIVVQP